MTSISYVDNTIVLKTLAAFVNDFNDTLHYAYNEALPRCIESATVKDGDVWAVWANDEGTFVQITDATLLSSVIDDEYRYVSCIDLLRGKVDKIRWYELVKYSKLLHRIPEGNQLDESPQE